MYRRILETYKRGYRQENSKQGHIRVNTTTLDLCGGAGAVIKKVSQVFLRERQQEKKEKKRKMLPTNEGTRGRMDQKVA